MTRRVVATVLVLITAILAAVAIPLGTLTAAQERSSFRGHVVNAAQMLAGLAEERIADQAADPGMKRLLAGLADGGDRAAVYDTAGRRLAGTGTWAAPPGRVPPGHPSAATASYGTGGRLAALAPVVPDSGTGTIGTAVVSRSTAPLDRQVREIWTLIAAVAAAGLLAAAVVAAGIAHWIARPLTRLDDAARRLGDGELDSRAPPGAGPAEVRRLTASFNSMAARLQNLIRGHRAMLADVSHQVRTPLAALRLRLDLLAAESDPQAAAELACAQDEIARLSRLVTGLLAIGRAEHVTGRPSEVAVDTVLRDRVGAWGPAADERGVALTLLVPGSGPGPGEGGPAGATAVAALALDGHLEQILDNLLANALEAVPRGGTIRVGAAAADGRVRITVADDGPGMSPQQRAAAFRRFSTGTPGGTGLGLAIVDRLARANGGSAALSDTPGGGLTVTIGLPAASGAGPRT